jgi:hypothetical protein
MKRRTGKVSLLKLCHPTSEMECLLFKGELSQNVTEHVSQNFGSISWLSGATSPKLYVFLDRGLLLGGQREREEGEDYLV